MAEIGAVISVPDNGLAYQGTVTAVPGTNQFTIPSLAGLGAGLFAGTTPYYAVVVRKSTGTSAAPQGQQQMVTAYNTITGNFTTAAFTVPVAINDVVQIMSADLAANPTILAAISSSIGLGTDKIYPTGITVAPAATLTLNNGALVIGDLTVGAGALLVINGNCHVTGSVTNAGTIVVSDFRCDGSFGNTNSGTITVEGNYQVANNTTNTGTITIMGDLTGSTNANTGTIFVNGNVQGNAVAGPGGTFTVNLSVEGGVNNTGGVIAIGGDATHYGPFMTNSGVTSIGDNFSASGSITNSDVLSVGGDLTVGQDVGNTLNSTFSISRNAWVAGTITNDGVFSVAFELSIATGLINSGTLTGSPISFTNFVVVITPSGGASTISKIIVEHNLTITFFTGGNLAVEVNDATFTIFAGCTGGTVDLYGVNCTLVDNSGGLVTVVDHRIPSGGATPQQIVDAVWVDTVNGVAGTTGTIGTPTNPVNNDADMITILTARKLLKVVVVGIGTLQLTADITTPITFEGQGVALATANQPTIDLNGYHANGSSFINLAIKNTGAAITSADNYQSCQIYATVDGGTYVDCHFINVTNTGTLVIVNSQSDSDFTNSGTIAVYGNFIVGGTYYESGTAVFNANLETGGLNASNDTANITINGDLSCAGALSLGGGTSGNLTLKGNLTTGSSITLAAGANITGNNLTTGLNGYITLAAGAYINGNNLDCGGALNAGFDSVIITLAGDCKVAGAFSLGGGTSGSLTLQGDLTTGTYGAIILAAGASIIGNDITTGTSGAITLAAGAIITGNNLDCGGNLNASYDSVHITLQGDCKVAGSFSLGGGTSGSLTVQGDLTTGQYGTITLDAGSAIYGNNITTGQYGTITLDAGSAIYGNNITTGQESTITLAAGAYITGNNLDCGGNLNAGYDSVIITLAGDCKVAGTFTLGGGVSDSIIVAGNFSANGTTIAVGSICAISGHAETGTLSNSGTFTYVYGTQPEQAVNLSVDNTGEDVLNYSTPGLHYTVKSLWLNFTDPVADNYTVDLYQLINGVSTIVDTATILTPGGFYNLMDLFGVPLLEGDNLEVKVTLSVAGPLAVTGSYVYGVE